MKRTLLILYALSLSVFLISEPIEIVSHKKLARGFYPILSADGNSIEYSSDENVWHNIAPIEGEVYVTNDELKLVLYNHGVRHELYPHGRDVNYVWASLSPDKQKIVFNTKYGTAVCDLQGKELSNLGRLHAPVWYGSNHIVGMCDEDDGDRYTASSIVIKSLDGSLVQTLTNPYEMGMYPSVNAQKGLIAYSTLNGAVNLLQIDKVVVEGFDTLRKATFEPFVPLLVESESLPESKRMLKPARAPKAMYTDFSQVKIYINPGHGGHDPDDRNIVIYPFRQGDPEGFWESNANLDKGLQLRKWLNELGMQTMMSRTTNTTADDRALSAIVAEANAYKADFMLSIHSNAGGPANYVLELYAGKDLDDTRIYADEKNKQTQQRSHDISTLIGNNLFENKITTWSTSKPRITGDKTFGRDAMGWSNGYGVLRNLSVPGVISEGCMHDYLPEAYRMMNMDYKWKESWYFMKTFCTYFLDYKLTEGVIAGQVRDSYNKMIFPVIKTIKNSRDELLPIDRAMVTLLKDGEEIGRYQTDTLYNGVFFFWNLSPGKYTVRVEADHYYTKETEVEVEANEITYQDMLIDMKRETRPYVLNYSPHVELEDSQEVAIPIVLNFNWDMLAEPTIAAFSISPEVEGTLVLENSQRTLRFTPAVAFEKGTEYTVRLDKSACHPDFNYSNTMADDFVFRFRTKNRAKLSVKQTYPLDGAENVDLEPTIMVLFDMKLDASSSKPQAITITNGSDYLYNPNARILRRNTVKSPYGSLRFDITEDSRLQPQTRYTVTIASTVRDTCNVPLLEPYSFSFTTKAQTKTIEAESVNTIDSIFFRYNAESSVGVKDATILADASKYTQGKASDAVGYVFFSENDDESLFLSPLDLTYIFVDSDTLLIDVYGDLSYNRMYAIFETEGDRHELELCNLDYSGWKTQALSLANLPHAVEFQFTGLRIVRQNTLLSDKGTIYLDALRRAKGITSDLVNNHAYSSNSARKIIYNNGIYILMPDGSIYNTLGTKVNGKK